VFSNDGNYILRLTYEGGGDFITVSSAELFDLSEGTCRLKLEAPGFSEALISNRGEILGINRNLNIAEQSSLKLYNISGALVNEVPLPLITQVKIGGEDKVIGAISGKSGLALYSWEGIKIAQLTDC
jgi:hypothetical protein